MKSKKKKDPMKEIVKMLEQYDEGTEPRSAKEHSCSCCHESHEHDE